MKNLLPFLALALLMGSCTDPSSSVRPSSPKSAYKPVLMDRATLNNSIAFGPAKDLAIPAKIYIKGNYLFISEQFKGVHVYDNTDPSAPKNLGFIRIPGCLDMAVKDNTLYADNSTDMVAIDLSDPANPTVSKRIASVLPEPTPPDGLLLDDPYTAAQRPANTVIVDWVKISK
jgi:hypothetical protein